MGWETVAIAKTANKATASGASPATIAGSSRTELKNEVLKRFFRDDEAAVGAAEAK